jgi:hypothetical protein
MYHEDAIELAVLHRGITNSEIVTGEYLAVYRRILKFIMETGCDVSMKIISPTWSDNDRIHLILDDLLFLGDMILMSVSLYAEQAMIEDLAEVYFDKNDLYVFSRRHHYNFIFDHILNEWGHMVEKIVIDDQGFADLFKITENCLNVKYKDAGHIIASIHDQIHFTEGFSWDALPINLNLLFTLQSKWKIVF